MTLCFQTNYNVILKVLSFIVDEQITKADLENLVTETQLTTLMANHLFGKLSTSSRYVMDSYCVGKKKDNCLCGKKDCKLTGTYGDTSIGKCY